ncbi:SDR family oxidoreductase [Eubacterium callanderi]|uniref:SDR family oxidoreductase n=1 Tax=Eubacterium callanderi TaxID=53442 RepID=UPI0022E09742|nr:SDR family oxidoreductase [Eubacterium callanderi]
MGYENITFPKETKFLITGGAGFIGSNLCEALLKRGHFVRCLDDLSTGKEENIQPFLENPNFEFIKGDIRDLDICMNACKDIDYVSHQAAWGSVPRSIEMPLVYEGINIKGTLNMLEAARQNNVKKFVYASSSSVYGDEPTLPKREGREGNLLSPYALTKRTNEEYAALYTKLYGLETIGFRYFNVFGRRQDPDGAYAAVIPKFVKNLLENEAPTINGDGTQSRDFTYIENVIEANLKGMQAPREAAGEAFNIAYGGQVDLNELYQKLSELLNKKIESVYGPERAGDIKHSNADIGKAREILGYAPEYSFERGIELTIEWYKKDMTSHLKINSAYIESCIHNYKNNL